MSLQAQQIPPIPEATVAVARRAFRKGNVYMQMRDVFGTFFTDDQFRDLYPSEGQPAYAPWRLALVSIMQFAENLCDRQAADAVRSRIDWKYALSLELDDSGFDFSVLSEFRQRLLEHTAGEQMLNTLLEHFKQAGLLKGRGTQRTDSTHVIAKVRDLNRLELVGRTLQAALDAIAEVAPQWLQAWVSPDWYTRYGQVLTTFRLPEKGAERDALAVQIGWDGITLFQRVCRHPDTPPQVRNLPALRTLQAIWIQQFVQIEDTLRLRTREEMPPAARLIQSPFDLEARYSAKRDKEWLGYKVHLTETCDEDAPHLIILVHTVNATEQDFDALQPIHEALQERELLPTTHLVDRGYTSAPLLVDSQTQFEVDLCGPLVEKKFWQHTTGYPIAAFVIDWDKHHVTCPQGKVSYPWSMRPHRRQHELTRVKFRVADCKPCPVHDRCTLHDHRTLSFHEQPLFEAVQRRKQEQHTPEFRQRYGKRAGIEGTISQGVFALAMRQSRYRGLDKTHLQFILTAAAMNLTRVINWHNEVERKSTQPTRFGRLAA